MTRILINARYSVSLLNYKVPLNFRTIFKVKSNENVCVLHNFCSFRGQRIAGNKVQQTVPFWSVRYYTKREQNIRNRNTLYYLSAFTIFVSGCTYSSVLLYRLYCQTTGKGGQAVLEEAGDKISKMTAVKHRNITVNFNADINSAMLWNFKPQQPFIRVAPGETALAFYTALNPTDKAITGVATYNVLPFEAGRYFNKIQCFCFEEQQLNPHEQVDMPVFFYLDPAYSEDPRLEYVNDIILSYTFFEAKEGMQLPRPSFM